MIRSLILVAAVGLATAVLTLGAAAWLGPSAALEFDLPLLALALGLAAASLTGVAAIVVSFRPSFGRSKRTSALA